MSRRKRAGAQALTGVYAPTYRGGESNVPRLLGGKLVEEANARAGDKPDCERYEASALEEGCLNRAIRNGDTHVCPAVCALYRPKGTA
jgi:hypothetical protein